MLKILVVEDDDTMQDILRAMLSHLDYVPTVVSDAATGLKTYQQEAYPILLLDVMLPGTDGLELCRSIRRLPKGDESVILVITAYSEMETLQNALAAGADDYLPKPFDKKLLEVRLTIAENRLHERWQRKRFEHKLRESEAKWRSLVENAPDTIMTIDRHYDISFINRMLPDLPPQSYLGTSVLSPQLLAQSEISRVREKFDSVFETGQRAHFEFQGVVGVNEKLGWYECSVGPIYENDAVESLILMMANISDRKLAEQERMHLESQLRHSQKMEAIGTLAGGVAHDFNNLLVPIIGFSNMLRNRLPSGSKDIEYLEKIIKAGKRAKGLVDQILIFSRKADVQRKPIRLSGVIEEVHQLLQESLSDNISMDVETPQEIHPVLADLSQMHQVLMNLCTNARDAMREGGKIWIRLANCHADEVEIPQNVPSTSAYVHLCVKDNGKGMDLVTKERIFDPFFTTKEVHKGTGLGLSLVLSIVEQHGGWLTVDSEIGQGSTFNIYLPAWIENAKPMIPEAPKRNFQGNESILFVDDEELICELSSVVLKELGYQVTTVTNAAHALELFRKASQAYDLIITDYAMPNMSGDMLTEAIRHLNSTIPIIMSTGYSEESSGDQFEHLAINATIQKPYDSEKLSHLVRQVLDSTPKKG